MFNFKTVMSQVTMRNYRNGNPEVDLSIFLLEDLNDFFGFRKLVEEELDDLSKTRAGKR